MVFVVHSHNLFDIFLLSTFSVFPADRGSFAVRRLTSVAKFYTLEKYYLAERIRTARGRVQIFRTQPENEENTAHDRREYANEKSVGALAAPKRVCPSAWNGNESKRLRIDLSILLQPVPEYIPRIYKTAEVNTSSVRLRIFTISCAPFAFIGTICHSDLAIRSRCPHGVWV